MCGIIGILNRGENMLVCSALDSIRHRGPDDKSVIRKGETVLGHTRLAIQDLSDLGRQPMISACGRFTIVFNGEIYNTQQLLTKSFAANVKLKGNSDTEVLLEYLSCAIRNNFSFSAALELLNGIFSFVLYDSELQVSYMVRDHMGIKPLYYKDTDGAVIFCSELGGLNMLTSDAPLLNTDDLVRYLCFLWNPGDSELFCGVNSIPPGYFAKVFSNGTLDLNKWYTLPLEKSISKSKLGEKELCEQIRETFSEVISSQLISDAPVGCFLSGGLDSSAICSVATKYSDNLTFFTIDAGEEVDDQVSDLQYANDVARHLGVEVTEVQIPQDRFLPQLQRMVRSLGEPIADPAALNTLLICEAANVAGMKVMLSGTGGDDIFTGYRRHIASRYAEKVDKYVKPLEHYVRLLHTILRRLGYKNRRVVKLLDSLFLDRSERLIGYFKWSETDRAIHLMEESHRSQINKAVIDAPMTEYLQSLDGRLTELQAALLLEQKFFMTNHNLVYTDRMSMATGVEVRVPFLDPRMIDLASTIPDKYLQNGRVGKWIFKKSMEPILPSHIIYRSKTGFGLPIRKWIRGSVNELRETYLSRQKIREAGIFNYNAVTKLLSDFENRDGDLAYTVFALTCCQIWHFECFSENL